MTELMQILLTEIQEKRIQTFYTSQYYLYEKRIRPHRETLVLDALPEAQKPLLDSYNEAVMDQYALQEEALFLATLDIVKELYHIFR